MKALFKIVGICLVAFCFHLNVAAAKPKPKAPAFDAALLKETEAFLRAVDKVLVVKGDGSDTKRRADHSRWGQDIKKRAVVFVGSGTDREQFESPYRPCQMATHAAVEIWMAKLNYESRPTKSYHDWIERATRDYQEEMSSCRAAKR